MENNYKIEGEKYEKNLSFHEAAKILGTSNVKILELLRTHEILFKIQNRNIPYDKYIVKKWFEVIYSEIDTTNFVGIVPIVKITKKGFEKIEELLINDIKYIKIYNQRTFWKVIKNLMNKKINELNINYTDMNDWLSKNTITHNNKNIVTIFTFINSERIDLISYNLDKKTIIDNER